MVLPRYMVSTGNPSGTPSSEGCWKADGRREEHDKNTLSADLLGFRSTKYSRNNVEIRKTRETDQFPLSYADTCPLPAGFWFVSLYRTRF